MVLQVSWMTDFEQELTRRGVFVLPGSAAFNHFAFFKSKRSTRQMSDDSSISIFGSQSLAKRSGERFHNGGMRRQKLSLISGITVTTLTSHKDHDRTDL